MRRKKKILLRGRARGALVGGLGSTLRPSAPRPRTCFRGRPGVASLWANRDGRDPLGGCGSAWEFAAKNAGRCQEFEIPRVARVSRVSGEWHCCWKLRRPGG